MHTQNPTNVISPAQLILLALEYNNQTNNLYESYLQIVEEKGGEFVNDTISKDLFFDRLYRAYLIGTHFENFLENLKSAAKLDDYVLSRSYETIDNDTSRRCFETIIARELALKSIDNLTLMYLQRIVQILETVLEQSLVEKDNGPILIAELKKVLTGNISNDNKDPFDKEYSDIIKLINDDKCNLTFINEEDKQKAVALVQFFHLSSLCTEFVDGFDTFDPIYDSKKIYTSEERGREAKLGNESVPSNHLGIFRSTDNPLGEEFILSSESISRPTDKYRRQPGNKWTRISTMRGIHPHVGSISGSVLMLMNTIYYIAKKRPDQQILADDKAFENTLVGSIFLVLYLAGGHSIYEFLYPFSIPTIQQRLSAVWYQSNEIWIRLNLETLILNKNQPLFVKSLHATVDFHNRRNLQDTLLKEIGDYAPGISNFFRLLRIEKEKKEKKFNSIINDEKKTILKKTRLLYEYGYFRPTNSQLIQRNNTSDNNNLTPRETL